MLSQEILKGTIKPLIVKLISENEKMYGYQITQKVKELSSDKVIITEGALYPALHKLEREGILDSKTECIGNRERKYYFLSEKGKKEAVGKLDEIRESISLIARLFDINTSYYGIG